MAREKSTKTQLTFLFKYSNCKISTRSTSSFPIQIDESEIINNASRYKRNQAKHEQIEQMNAEREEKTRAGIRDSLYSYPLLSWLDLESYKPEAYISCLQCGHKQYISNSTPDFSKEEPKEETTEVEVFTKPE